MKFGRREFIMTATSALIAGHPKAIAAPETPPKAAHPAGFSFQNVVGIAESLGRKPFVPLHAALPQTLADLSYDAYRRIQSLHPKALWADDDLGFRVEMFHRGGLFKERVDIYEIRDGKPQLLTYSADQFLYDPPLTSPLPADTGFAGFRLIAQNGIDLDEIAAFVGASYFRALGRGQQYGLSARGLAIGTGTGSEEFPYFRAFWIERPTKGDTRIVVYALLDSESLSGAYRFVITPGSTTLFEVETTLFPRRVITHIGIAPLTSMYLFGSTNPGRFEDFRAAVHDSDGLALLTGRGEAIWRPLSNPPRLAESAFSDAQPRGFGLMQRATAFEDYNDAEAHYHRRPSAWVNPIGDWGEGAVHLFELPSDSEGFDNIVAFWRAKAPLQPNQRHSFRYNINWGAPRILSHLTKARVSQTRIGRAPDGAGRLMVVDFSGLPSTLARLKAQLTTTAGQVSSVLLQPLSAPGSGRATFTFIPGATQSADLRLVLLEDNTPISETWIYRWTS